MPNASKVGFRGNLLTEVSYFSPGLQHVCLGMLCILSGKEEWNKKEDFKRGPYLLGTVTGGDDDSQQLSYFIKPSIIQRVLEFILKHISI